MTLRLAVVYNPKSGSNELNANQIQALFSGLNVEIDFFLITKDLEALNLALEDGKYGVIVACGGDGTVNTCAKYAAKHKVALGVLPAGTLNHFAKDAGLPQDLESAAKAIVQGKTIRVDCASVNDNVFVNNASIGAYPSIVTHREALESKIGKWPAAGVATIRSLVSKPTRQLSIAVPSGSFKYQTSMLFVGNNSYEFHKLGFNNRSTLNAGKLFLYVIHDNNRLAITTSALLAFFGKKRQQRDLLLNTKGPIIVNAKAGKLRVAVDGEVLSLQSPINFMIHPGLLSLRVPSNKSR